MIHVECYSGYRINERPRAFTLKDRSYCVREVLDSWYGETSQYFKVEADDYNIYLLKYDNFQDEWDLVFFQDVGKRDVGISQSVAVKPLLWLTTHRKSPPHPHAIH